MAISQSATITAANQFTTPMGITGWFNISVRSPSGGTNFGGGTFTLQRSFDGGTIWRDVRRYTAPAEEYGFEPEGALYRIGAKTSEYTSSGEVRIGHEGGMTH